MIIINHINNGTNRLVLVVTIFVVGKFKQMERPLAENVVSLFS